MKFFILLFLLTFYSFQSFADSAKIGNKNALIIIDMQPIFVTRNGDQDEAGNVAKVKEILKNQIEVIKLARAAKIPIIFLEYENLGDTTSELKKAVEGYADTKYFLKNTDGMLSSYNTHKKELIAYLESKNIGNLIITGANGGACVYSSISESLSNNYSVLAFTNGIADFNYKEFIYPYKHIYTFKPTCATCKFKEIEDIGVIALELAKQTNEKSGAEDNKVNDSGRDMKKDMPKRSGDQQKRADSIAK